MIELLKKLISIESLSYQEKEVTDFVESLLKEGNGDINRHGNSLVWKNEWIEGKKSIALGAHLDTVPFTNEDWKITQACIPLEKDDKIYGRGSCDMKAGAAILLDLILKKDLGGQFNIMAFFYDREELGMPNGVTDLIELGYFKNIDLCIIPEPTECLVNYGVLGNLDAKLIARGIAAHSSAPAKGSNAIYHLLPSLEKIKNHPVNKVGKISEAISLNMIKGGNAINIIPDKAEAYLDYRFDPDYSRNDMQQILRGFESENVESQILGYYPGVSNKPEDHTLIQSLCNIAGEGGIVPFWTDIGQLGTIGIAAVNYGPGSIDQAHRADEFVAVEDLHTVRDNLKRFLHKS